MNYYSLALGLFMLLHGSFILLTRAKAKHQQARLNFMTKALGKPFGTTIYAIIYVILPIGFGIYITHAGFNGIGISELFIGATQVTATGQVAG